MVCGLNDAFIWNFRARWRWHPYLPACVAEAGRQNSKIVREVALDSIPAVLAITSSAFIVFTSNIFAILGLRSLYFALHGVMGLFRYLGLGLAVILVFIGGKMLIEDIYPIGIGVALAVIGSVIALSVAASLIFPDKEKPSA